MIWSNTHYNSGRYTVDNLEISHCFHCKDFSLWLNAKMIYPAKILVDSPNSDLPEDIKKDYLEAASILSESSRGSSALLRIAIEKLVNYLGALGSNLNAKIGFLVSDRNLNPKIQKSLDVVRVIGNNAVHPGLIDLTDDRSTAELLFKLVNIIAKEMITEPNEVDSIYSELVPEKNKIAIKKRDTK